MFLQMDVLMLCISTMFICSNMQKGMVPYDIVYALGSRIVKRDSGDTSYGSKQNIGGIFKQQSMKLSSNYVMVTEQVNAYDKAPLC